MATFLVKNKIEIVRQAGDDCDIVFTVPDIYPLTGGVVSFKAFSKTHGVLFEAISTGANLAVAGQTITITIADTVTKGLHGTFDWKLWCDKSGDITTIGYGELKLLKMLE